MHISFYLPIKMANIRKLERLRIDNGFHRFPMTVETMEVSKLGKRQTRGVTVKKYTIEGHFEFAISTFWKFSINFWRVETSRGGTFPSRRVHYKNRRRIFNFGEIPIGAILCTNTTSFLTSSCIIWRMFKLFSYVRMYGKVSTSFSKLCILCIACTIRLGHNSITFFQVK